MKLFWDLQKTNTPVHLVKNILALLCMGTELEIETNVFDIRFLNHTFLNHHANYKKLWNLAEDIRAEDDDLLPKHAFKTEVNADECNIEFVFASVTRTTRFIFNLPPDGTFATQTFQEWPSQFIRATVAAFPEEE